MSFQRCLSRVAAVLVSGFAVVVVGDACIIVDPPGDLPQLPEIRPTIVHGSVVPPQSIVLGTWPANDIFIVPVELVDPTRAFQWAAFVDYNPLTRTGIDVSGTSNFGAQNQKTRGRIRTLEIPIARPPIDACHVIEVVVAFQFDERNQHAPIDPPGGDSVSWFFNPSGDLSGCPALDSGVDARPDADASDGAGDAVIDGVIQ